MKKRDQLAETVLGYDPSLKKDDIVVAFEHDLTKDNSDVHIDGICALIDNKVSAPEIRLYESGELKEKIELDRCSDFVSNVGVGCVMLECRIDGEERMLCRADNSFAKLYAAVTKRFNKYKEKRTYSYDYEEDLLRFCPKCGRPIHPGMTICEHCVSKGKYLKRLWDIASPYKWYIFLSTFLFFVVTVVNMLPPYINRILVDRISHTLFCPTETAIRNLENEGYRNFGIKIVRSGDVMYDAALYYAEKIKTRPSFLEKTGLAGRRFILATIHRAENTDDIEKLSSIIKALDTVSESENVILPIHPRTKKILADNGIIPRFTVIDPVGYFEMLELLQNCSAVMTDSGGVQKEAYFFKKQCITLREETEWVELIENGFNTIAGSDFDKIVSAYKKLSEKDPDFDIQLYGNGNAAGEIVTNLLENCGE